MGLSIAVVLFSGGIDSTTVLAVAIQSGFSPITLRFDYGQRHSVELKKATEVLRQFEIRKDVLLSIDLRRVGGSALTGDWDVPKNRPVDDSIPVTYVPARNLIFLSIAAAVAEAHQAYDIFFGANVLDYSGYPDCRPDFIEAMENTINLGTKAGREGQRFRIHAPLLKLNKSEIIKRGIELGVDYRHTHSCYDPSAEGLSCGRCDSCRLRLKGFEEAGLKDPAVYQV